MPTLLLFLAFLQPSTAAAPSTDGWDFLEQGKFLFAKISFTNRLRREPENATARLGLGLALLELGDPDTACRQLLEVIQTLPEDPRARLGLARALWLRARDRIAVGDWDDETHLLLLDAAQQAEHAARLSATEPGPWLLIAKVRFELRELEAARLALEQAARLGGSAESVSLLSAELDCLQVLTRAESKDLEFDEARVRLERIASQFQDAAMPWIHLGDLFAMFDQPLDAIHAYGQSLRRDPFQRDLLEYLLGFLPVPELQAALAVAFCGAVEAAEERSQDKEDPRPAAALQALAEVKLESRDWKEARSLFERAVQLDDQRRVACDLGRGACAFQLQDHQDATDAYLDAIRTNPAACLRRLDRLGSSKRVGSSLVYLSHRCTESKRLDDARDLLSAAVDLLPQDAGVRNNHAFLCRETGRYEEAERSYRVLLKLTPGDPRAWNDTALILQYHLHRDLDEARQMYRRAIDLAEEILASPDTPNEAREGARSARQDAEDNLRKMD